MKIEAIGRLRENIIKERGGEDIELRSVQDKDDKIVFTARHYVPPTIALTGEADKRGKLLELHSSPLPVSLPRSKPEKVEMVKKVLETSGYTFEHPILILEGRDGWFVILVPHRSPFQVIVHWDGKGADFFATLPEMIE